MWTMCGLIFDAGIDFENWKSWQQKVLEVLVQHLSCYILVLFFLWVFSALLAKWVGVYLKNWCMHTVAFGAISPILTFQDSIQSVHCPKLRQSNQHYTGILFSIWKLSLLPKTIILQDFQTRKHSCICVTCTCHWLDMIKQGRAHG